MPAACLAWYGPHRSKEKVALSFRTFLTLRTFLSCRTFLSFRTFLSSRTFLTLRTLRTSRAVGDLARLSMWPQAPLPDDAVPVPWAL